MFLKDMSILFKYTFAYRWSFTNNYNTAVIGVNHGLVAQNDNLFSLFINSHNSVSSLIDALHPYILSARIRSHVQNEIFSYRPLRTFHSALFDPAWLCLDGQVPNPDSRNVCSPADFTNRKLVEPCEFSPDDFFSGAFAYHLHLSRKDFQIKNDAYFTYFEKYFAKKLNISWISLRTTTFKSTFKSTTREQSTSTMTPNSTWISLNNSLSTQFRSNSTFKMATKNSTWISLNNFTSDISTRSASNYTFNSTNSTTF